MSDTVKAYASFISKQIDEGKVIVEAKEKDRTFSIDYHNPKDSQEGAFADAQDHIKEMGYNVSHDRSANPEHKEVENPDITYHYAMGDSEPHALTIHAGGKAANDKELKQKVRGLMRV